jgi:hypothetical protein
MYKETMHSVILTTCNSSIEAHFKKSLLEDNEIECYLINENFSNLLPGYNGMMGAGIQIMIDERDLERARKIIEPEIEADAPLVCPSCHSTNISMGLGRNKIKKVVLILLSLLIPIPFGNVKCTHYCSNCKVEF